MKHRSILNIFGPSKLHSFECTVPACFCTLPTRIIHFNFIPSWISFCCHRLLRNSISNFLHWRRRCCILYCCFSFQRRIAIAMDVWMEVIVFEICCMCVWLESFVRLHLKRYFPVTFNFRGFMTRYLLATFCFIFFGNVAFNFLRGE